MKPLLTDLWPQFAEDAEFRSAFGGAVVDKVLANRQHRLITVVYSAPAPAPRAACDRLALSLAPLFKGFSLRVRGLFPYESLTPQAVLDLVQELKEEGLWFVCADMDGELMYNLDLKGPIGLVIGNEGEGVGRLVKENCDFTASIPMKGDIDSLNASVAAGVLAYEIVRQRMS